MQQDIIKILSLHTILKYFLKGSSVYFLTLKLSFKKMAGKGVIQLSAQTGCCDGQWILFPQRNAASSFNQLWKLIKPHSKCFWLFLCEQQVGKRILYMIYSATLSHSEYKHSSIFRSSKVSSQTVALLKPDPKENEQFYFPDFSVKTLKSF